MEKVLADKFEVLKEGEIFPILKKYRPQSWFKMIPDLLAQENSGFVNSTYVRDYINRREQSLLTPILKDGLSFLFELKGAYTYFLRLILLKQWFRCLLEASSTLPS
jgi:hypothetical protein